MANKRAKRLARLTPAQKEALAKGRPLRHVKRPVDITTVGKQVGTTCLLHGTMMGVKQCPVCKLQKAAPEMFAALVAVRDWAQYGTHGKMLPAGLRDEVLAAIKSAEAEKL
jgi:hypothetical protein